MERETSEYKSRTIKWRELVTRAQEEMEVTAGVPESLQTFSWHVEKIFVLIWFLLDCSLFSEPCLFVASHFFSRMWQARPGHVVLFNLPTSTDGRGIEIGLVISECWRGIKAPRIFSGPTQVNSCWAFRVVTLELHIQHRPFWFFFRDAGMSACHLYSKNPKLLRRVFVATFWWHIGLYCNGISLRKLPHSEDDANTWFCCSKSVAWTLRLESLITVLEVQHCYLEVCLVVVVLCEVCFRGLFRLAVGMWIFVPKQNWDNHGQPIL